MINQGEFAALLDEFKKLNVRMDKTEERLQKRDDESASIGSILMSIQQELKELCSLASKIESQWEPKPWFSKPNFSSKQDLPTATPSEDSIDDVNTKKVEETVQEKLKTCSNLKRL
uniref:Uncharacterized protein n=1 Tax=Chenopodium quinoa TaxID=63459 RepID=A0A803LFQ7_CHEQI